jgi:hypothetical protein
VSGASRGARRWVARGGALHPAWQLRYYGTPALKVARSVNDWAALGFEYYLDLGQITHLLPYAQQSHMLFIAADIDLKPWAFNFGVGRRFGDDADRWTVKAILEVPDF